MKMDILRRAVNMAILSAAAADNPKKTFATLKKHASATSIEGLSSDVHLIRNTKAVNIDWTNIINGTDVKEKTVNTILLKITIMNELLMYNKMDGQCICVCVKTVNKLNKEQIGFIVWFRSAEQVDTHVYFVIYFSQNFEYAL